MSFLNPRDRKFSVIKRPIMKCGRIYTPREVCELIVNAEKTSWGTPVETDMITGFSTWWPARYKKLQILSKSGTYQETKNKSSVSQNIIFFCTLMKTKVL